MRIFEVGGAIRDSLLGMTNKDLDYAVEAESFEAMHSYIESISDKIFLVTPEYLTIRALVDGKARDYVLCRKDGAYSDGRRPDQVTPGTIYDDLARRDFTINAIAKDMDTGEILDPFGGVQDCKEGVIRCVGHTEDRFNEDSLRILRALRFSITKNMRVVTPIEMVFQSEEWAQKLASVSTERIREELHKCFKYNTKATLMRLASMNKEYLNRVFDPIWLKPTTES